MADWSDLDFDVLQLIAEKLEYLEDLTAFGGVSSLCGRVTQQAQAQAREPLPSRHTPWLLYHYWSLPTKLQFQGLNQRIVFERELPVLATLTGAGARKYEGTVSNWSSSHGWLICSTEIGHRVNLVHPVTGMLIHSPSFPKEIIVGYDDYYNFVMFSGGIKYALSDNPLTTSNYTLSVVSPVKGVKGCLGLWRNGDNKWTTISEPNRHIRDSLFYKGKFYVVDDKGNVLATPTPTGNSSNPSLKLVASVEIGPKSAYLHLVVSDDSLLLISNEAPRERQTNDLREYIFKVWAVNVDNQEVNRVRNIGNRVIFVGDNAAFSLGVRPFQGFRPNCIYYAWSFGVYVFDLALGNYILDTYVDPKAVFPYSSSLWVENSLMYSDY